ncbi:endolytic transglycosylase MltG [Alginatibacterium sediminis]|uniref:Endolytic murein transglycosylase n=1 Tax=Alginatibacterium sediminis TaxID=2164068 RepID=A0A420EHI0_9ALTE|nr:endolytic transglycosylase MltG [Alginatibacterium sediminis]RKF20128.1 endolytic transglycosylase MltG [Alginatibacterium sediminis]
MIRLIKILVSLFVVASIALVAGGYLFVQSSNDLWHKSQSFESQVYNVQSGSNLNRVLNDMFILDEIDRFRLRLWFKLDPSTASVRKGHFELNDGMSFADISETLQTAAEYQYRVTIIAGETFKNVWQQLNQSEGLLASEFNESQIIEQLSVEHASMEGLLLPETYFFTSGTNAFDIVQRAHIALKQKLAQEWDNSERPDTPLKNAYDALILASIIEKESGQAAERPLIASVFINRMHANMRLQTDPTVIYGMGDRYDGRIRKKDLREATPYNTYVISGLPPTPIAMASSEAIEAALNPDESKFYYFVAKGAGEHYFSKNLAEHNRAVRKYILKK